MKPTSRRNFIKTSSLAAGAIPFLNTMPSWAFGKDSEKLSVHIFSKHIQFLDFKEVGQLTAELGFDGVDLTVRKGGHVEPEKVELELPKAVSAIKKGGSTCLLMSTDIKDSASKLDQRVLKSASEEGIQFYRSSWFRYSTTGNLVSELAEYQQKATDLSLLNKQNNIIGCYQNHPGNYVGASIWEVKELLKHADLNYFGAQYDIRHAVVEGGLSWETGLRLIQENIKTIVLKDFKWGIVNGVWEVIDVPVGEGMVDFDRYFKLLKMYNINVPVSLHIEYPLFEGDFDALPLSTKKELVTKAMVQDLNSIQTLWRNA